MTDWLSNCLRSVTSSILLLHFPLSSLSSDAILIYVLPLVLDMTVHSHAKTGKITVGVI